GRRGRLVDDGITLCRLLEHSRRRRSSLRIVCLERQPAAVELDFDAVRKLLGRDADHRLIELDYYGSDEPLNRRLARGRDDERRDLRRALERREPHRAGPVPAERVGARAERTMFTAGLKHRHGLACLNAVLPSGDLAHCGRQTGMRPPVHGTPAASAFVSTRLRSVSTIVRKRFDMRANSPATMSY